MITPSAPDREINLGASLNRSELLADSLPKKALELEATKAYSEKQEAAEPLFPQPPQILKSSRVEEKHATDTQLLQKKHAKTSQVVPESKPLSLTLSGVNVVPSNKIPFLPSQTSELLNVEASLEMKARGLQSVVSSTENEASGAPSTEHLPTMHKVSPEAMDGFTFEASSNGHKSSPTTSSVDTAAPFESVKEAVTLFGERMDWKQQPEVLEEKRVAPGFDIQKANEEILRCKERIIVEEGSLARARDELEKIKEQIRLCKGEVPVTFASEGGSPPPNQPEEVSQDVSGATSLHMNLLREVELAQKEIKDALQERRHLETLKQIALIECEAAINAQKGASTRVQELVKEHVSVEESLAAAKAALAKTEADITFLKSIPSVKLEGESGDEPMEMSDSTIERLKSLKSNTSDLDPSMEKLIKELATIRGLHISNFDAELLGAKVRLDHAKIAEGNRVAALGRTLEQLDESKLNLKKAIDEGASLPTTVGALQLEVSKHQAELESAHETEQIACATLASLQDELCSVRAKVLSAQAGEAKAREAKRSLPLAIKQLALDADESKAASNLAKEEARKARLQVEQASACISTISSRIQAAQKDAEAARASEAMALAEFKALSESEGELGDKVTVTISYEEYRALHDTRLAAEEAADKKVAAVFVQVDRATASQEEAKGKLDATLKELEMLLKSMEEAQKKADDAQVAKLTVEAELRKWRAEHEQWRKLGSNPSSVNTSAAQSPRFVNGKSSQGKLISQSFQGKAVAGLDSLAEVLTLKVPSMDKAAKFMPEMDVPKAGKVKKVSFFTRVMSILVRKKSKSIK